MMRDIRFLCGDHDESDDDGEEILRQVVDILRCLLGENKILGSTLGLILVYRLHKQILGLWSISRVVSLIANSNI